VGSARRRSDKGWGNGKGNGNGYGNGYGKGKGNCARIVAVGVTRHRERRNMGESSSPKKPSLTRVARRIDATTRCSVVVPFCDSSVP